MKKFLLVALIAAVSSLGFASSHEHPTAGGTETDKQTQEEKALDRMVSEDSSGAKEEALTNKPKDHPAH